jgi:hypothetical protein
VRFDEKVAGRLADYHVRAVDPEPGADPWTNPRWLLTGLAAVLLGVHVVRLT